MITDPTAVGKFTKLLDRLINLAVSDYYNPYKEFIWPQEMSDDQYWMSLDLMSVYNTPVMEQLSDTQLKALSKWESINFYSMNVHGIRELLLEVIKRIHTHGFELPTEFFHHFVGEENEHMWFFAQFCLRYGQKLYEDKKMKLDGPGETDIDIEHFLVFARILIFEEIVDYFNVRMSKDETLNPIIRKINGLHHQDESRHIAFGREIVKLLHQQLCERYPADRLLLLENYLKRYIVSSLHSFYNPLVYRDAGILDPYKFRATLLQYPARDAYHHQIVKRTLDFFVKNQVFSRGGLSA